MKLTELKLGHKGRIVSINPTSSIYTRLNDIGFTKGSTVECVLKSPLGDPIAYLVKGSVIALRRNNSDEIEIGEAVYGA